MLLLEIIIGVVFIVLALKVNKASKAFSALAVVNGISGILYSLFKDFLEFLADEGTGYIFLFILIFSLIVDFVLALLEKDACFALTIIPSTVAASVLSSICFSYVLDTFMSGSSDISDLFGFITLPGIFLAFIVIVGIIVGSAILFPFAICYTTKHTSSHQIFTVASGAVCTVVISILISQSGLICYLTDSLDMLL